MRGDSDGVQERPGFAELPLDRLARRTAEVPEGGVFSEEDQIRPQVMIALQAGQVLDQRLRDPPRVPAGAGSAGVEIREVQPGRRSHDGETLVFVLGGGASLPLGVGGRHARERGWGHMR